MVSTASIELDRPLRLVCPIRHYAWGRAPKDSIISTLIGGSALGEQPCAELWVGAHHTAPARVESGSLTLEELIAANPEAILGARVIAEFGPTLPFMFKVLSVCKPLSIQAHPGRELAAKLHAANPAVYTDANHKPEISIALTDVELLYGFRSLAELQHLVRSAPELAGLLSDVPDAAAAEESEVIHRMFERVMRSPQHLITAASLKLFDRISAAADRTAEEAWILSLKNDFPSGDAGLFCFYFQNIQRRKPGEAVFIADNIPHAYLSGEMVECMANSDNVVRAGLTTKYRDVDTLLQMVDYTKRSIDTLQRTTLANGGLRYQIPATEFAIESYPAEFKAAAFSTSEGKGAGVQLLFSVTARGKLTAGGIDLEIAPGTAYLIPARVPSYQVSLQTRGLFRVFVP